MQWIEKIRERNKRLKETPTNTATVKTGGEAFDVGGFGGSGGGFGSSGGGMNFNPSYDSSPAKPIEVPNPSYHEKKPWAAKRPKKREVEKSKESIAKPKQ